MSLPPPPPYSTGSCQSYQPASNFSGLLPLFVQPHVYVSYFMSLNYALQYVETFQGAPAQNWGQVAELCFNLQFTDLLALQSGYNQTKSWINAAIPSVNVSNPIGIGTFTYTGTIKTSPGVNTSNQEVTRLTGLWTDGLAHALAVGCISPGTPQQSHVWALYSSGAPEPWVKQLSLEILANHSIDTSNALDFTDTPYFPFTCTDPPSVPVYTANILKSTGVLGNSFNFLPSQFYTLIVLLGTLVNSAEAALVPLVELLLKYMPAFG